MLNGSKASHGFAQRFRRRTACQSRRHRRQNILDIVRAAQLHLVARRQNPLAVFRSRDQVLPSQKQSVCQLFLDAELRHVRAQTIGPRRNDFVIRVQNRDVARCLIAKDVVLGGGIARQRFVAIHMIRRDIQHRGHRRMKIHDRFQLKAGKLNHIPPVVMR